MPSSVLMVYCPSLARLNSCPKRVYDSVMESIAQNKQIKPNICVNGHGGTGN